MRIIKNGIKNCVSEGLFKKIYEPQGWVKDEETAVVNEVEETIKELKDETKVKNYTKMKKTTPKKFDDNLIKKQK